MSSPEAVPYSLGFWEIGRNHVLLLKYNIVYCDNLRVSGFMCFIFVLLLYFTNLYIQYTYIHCESPSIICSPTLYPASTMRFSEFVTLPILKCVIDAVYKENDRYCHRKLINK